MAEEHQKEHGNETVENLNEKNGAHATKTGPNATNTAVNGHETTHAQKKPNFFTKWLRPDVYSDYAAMRRLVPKDLEIRYEPEIAHNAYYDPAISSETPLLWIPKDQLGLSKRAVSETSKVTPITDEGAYLDENAKIKWDADGGRPPVYQEKIYY